MLFPDPHAVRVGMKARASSLHRSVEALVFVLDPHLKATACRFRLTLPIEGPEQKALVTLRAKIAICEWEFVPFLRTIKALEKALRKQAKTDKTASEKLRAAFQALGWQVRDFKPWDSDLEIQIWATQAKLLEKVE